MADDQISIKVVAEVSSLQSQMAVASSTVEDFNARSKAALDAYNAAAAQGAEIQEILGEAFDKAHIAGASFVEAVEAANAAIATYVSAADQARTETLASASAEESAQIDVLTAAQRQFAEATLDAVAARKALNETVGESAELSDADAITLLAAAQRRATATAEQLALAKRNLAEAEEFAATAAAQEAGAVSEAAGAEEAGTAAIETRFAALEESTAATSAYVSGTLAANGALRVAEGSMMGATRAAASFLTTTLGLGPVLEVAFPVIGALALGEVVYDVIEKFVDLKRTANEAADNIEESFRKATDAIQDSTASIESETDRAQSQIDKLLGHPSQNGAKVAFDEAAEAAARLGSVIDADIEKTDQLISEQNKKNTVGFWQSLFTGKAETGDTQKLIQQVEDAIKSKNAEYEQPMELAEESGNKGSLASLQQDRLVDLEKVYADAEQKIGASLKSLQDKQADFIETGFGTDQTAKINLLVGALEKWHAEQRNIGAEYAKANVQGELTPLQEGSSGATEANKAQERHLRDLQDAFDKEELLYGKSALQTTAYWDQYVNDSGLGEKQLETVWAKLIEAQSEVNKEIDSGKIGEALKKQAEQAKTAAREYQAAVDDMVKAGRELQAATVTKPFEQKTQDQASQAHAQQISSLEETHERATVSFDTGLSNPEKQLAELRNFHQAVQEENERFAVEQIANLPGNDSKQVADMEQLQEALLAAEKSGNAKRIEDAQQALERQASLIAQSNTQQLPQMQELQNKLTEIVHQGNMKRLEDTAKELQQEQQKYKQVYDLITNDFNRAFEELASKEESASQAFKKMLLSMETGIEQLVLKYLEGQLFKSLMELLGLTNSANNAASGNQATLATDKTVNPEIVESNAAAAASVVFLTSGADAAAAAAAYAEGMLYFPLAAFEAGGIVGGSRGMPVPIMAHAGERVLSNTQTNNFERMVNQPQGGGTNHLHMNYAPNINAMDRTHMQSIVRSQADTILDIVKQGWKSGGLK